MTDTIRVYDPTGHVRVHEVVAATRPRSLDGLRPGILENRKANARVVMEEMIDGLRGRVTLGPLTVGSKPVAGAPSKATVEELRKNCDFILVGSSD
jgi:riboflavin biosynthesis pyrimidine reductase